MGLLVSKHVLVCLFLFVGPIFRLTPGATELVIVPVVFEAGLCSSLELLEEAIFRSLSVLFSMYDMFRLSRIASALQVRLVFFGALRKTYCSDL
jgi:hypothetical protein